MKKLGIVACLLLLAPTCGSASETVTPTTMVTPSTTSAPSTTVAPTVSTTVARDSSSDECPPLRSQNPFVYRKEIGSTSNCWEELKNARERLSVKVEMDQYFRLALPFSFPTISSFLSDFVERPHSQCEGDYASCSLEVFSPWLGEDLNACPVEIFATCASAAIDRLFLLADVACPYKEDPIYMDRIAQWSALWSAIKSDDSTYSPYLRSGRKKSDTETYNSYLDKNLTAVQYFIEELCPSQMQFAYDLEEFVASLPDYYIPVTSSVTDASSTTSLTYSNISTLGSLTFSDNSNIFVMDPYGIDVRQITDSSSYDIHPAFSPDGNKIAFTSVVENASRGADIFMMNRDGTDVVQLTETLYHNDGFPSWSPDGKEIAFMRERVGFVEAEIFVMNSDGTNVRQITDYEATEPSTMSMMPTWSPNGKKIAFVRQSWGAESNEIYVMNKDGSEVTQLTYSECSEWVPDWSLTVNKIAFECESHNGDYRSEIFLVNEDGSGLFQLTDFENDAPPFRSRTPSWSPDGRKIAFVGGVEAGMPKCLIMDVDGRTIVDTNIFTYRCDWGNQSR